MAVRDKLQHMFEAEWEGSQRQTDWREKEKARKAELKKEKEDFLSKLPYTYEDIKNLPSYKKVLALGCSDTTSEIMKKRRVTRFSVDSSTINEDIFKPAGSSDVAQRQELWKIKQGRESIWYFIERLIQGRRYRQPSTAPDEYRNGALVVQRNDYIGLENSFLKLVTNVLKQPVFNDAPTADELETLRQVVTDADDSVIRKLVELEDRYTFLRDSSKHYLVYPNGYLRYWNWTGQPRAGVLKKYDTATTIQEYSDLIERIYTTIEKRIGHIRDIKKDLPEV